MTEKAGVMGLAAGFRGPSAALQCALGQAARWPAAFLSVPLRLAPPANLHAVGNHKNHNISSSLWSAAAFCYVHGEENQCPKQSDKSVMLNYRRSNLTRWAS